MKKKWRDHKSQEKVVNYGYRERVSGLYYQPIFSSFGSLGLSGADYCVRAMTGFECGRAGIEVHFLRPAGLAPLHSANPKV
ncbi:MAG: hypothetical protein C0514_02300 [Candidatus Puniceispirillum sp.]|nr:hypothetical protein [Candidatus Puniceispirillum sp.]